MSVEAWIAFCITEAVLCLTPGPAVLLVVTLAMGRGLRPSIGAVFGVLTANALYFALSASGVAAALSASHELFILLRWIGAAYLLWLGLRMLLSRNASEQNPCPAVIARSFFRGFVVQGANPKALVFFMALLPQFIDPARSVPTQILVLGFSSVVIEFVSLAVYALGAFRAGIVVGNRAALLLERLGGGLLISLGVRLAVVRSD